MLSIDGFDGFWWRWCGEIVYWIRVKLPLRRYGFPSEEIMFSWTNRESKRHVNIGGDSIGIPIQCRLRYYSSVPQEKSRVLCTAQIRNRIIINLYTNLLECVRQMLNAPQWPRQMCASVCVCVCVWNMMATKSFRIGIRELCSMRLHSYSVIRQST